MIQPRLLLVLSFLARWLHSVLSDNGYQVLRLHFQQRNFEIRQCWCSNHFLWSFPEGDDLSGPREQGSPWIWEEDSEWRYLPRSPTRWSSPPYLIISAKIRKYNDKINLWISHRTHHRNYDACRITTLLFSFCDRLKRIDDCWWFDMDSQRKFSHILTIFRPHTKGALSCDHC